MVSQHLKKYFGTIAMEKGLITIDQLVDAVNTQVMEDSNKQKHRLIGSILFEHGHITMPEIDNLLESQKKIQAKAFILH